MGQVLEGLKKYVYNRRAPQNSAGRSQPNHPEEVPVDGFSTLRKTTSLSENSALSTDTNDGVQVTDIDGSSLLSIILTTSNSNQNRTTTTTRENQCSEFYLACRTNRIHKVRELLKTMTPEEIDRLEPNGSTALHSACYHGHDEIADLLLKAGADRSILNKFQCLPYDEAKNDRIRRLFFRIQSANRFVSSTGEIEWESIDNDAIINAAEDRQIIRSTYENACGAIGIQKMFEKIFKNYIDNRLNYIEGIDIVKRFCRKAMEEQDPIWIIKAYTAETDFYKILNKEIACGATMNQNERRYIIALLSHHPKLDPMIFIGCSYRVLQINQNDLDKYEENSFLMTKSFLSSSIDRKIAELFLCEKESSQQHVRTRSDGTQIKIWLMCIYHIKHRRTALHIENTSQYTSEGEVLIMPYTVFQIKRTEFITFRYERFARTIVEMELEECHQYFNTERPSIASCLSTTIERL
ncbi:hypothetical protein I4U23_023121 [Adineta vaga]|nr:hypothetical protein I4U23_023121 [Adineta vaga]